MTAALLIEIEPGIWADPLMPCNIQANQQDEDDGLWPSATIRWWAGEEGHYHLWSLEGEAYEKGDYAAANAAAVAKAREWAEKINAERSK